ESLIIDLRQLRRAADPDDGYVFRNRQGCRLSCSYARRLLREASLEVLGRAVSPHWMRHSHATHALENGAPLHVIQATLGHANVATTSAYLHVRPGEGSSKYLPLHRDSVAVRAPKPLDNPRG